MKTPRALALSIAATLFATPALAGLYRVDPNVSYVDAFVYQWTAWSSGLSITDDQGTSVAEPSVEWVPLPSLFRMPLSGNLEVATELSPDNPIWAHLLINGANIQTDAPMTVPLAEIPQAVVTYIAQTGEIYDIGLCGKDPYYSIPTYFKCGLYGVPPSVSGHIDAGILELTGSPGVPPMYIANPLGVHLPDYPNPPPPLDPAEYPSVVLGYHVVAHAVPEPATPALVLVAGLLAFAATPARSRPHR